MCFILKFMGQKCFVMKDEKKSEFLPIKKLYHRSRKDLKTLTDEIFNNMDTR